MKEAKKNDFTPIQDEKIIARYLQFMIDFHTLITWRIRESNILGESYAVAVQEKKIVRLALSARGPKPNKIKKAVVDSLERKLDLHYNAQGVQVFATAKVEKVDLETITIQVEKPIYKIQRRESVRVKISDSVKCTVEIPLLGRKKLLEVSPYDISLNGFSIVVSEEEADFFSKGDEFEKIVFHLEGKSSVVRAEVKNKLQQKSKKNPLFKVGFSVRNMSPAIEKTIYRLAFLQEVALLKNKL